MRGAIESEMILRRQRAAFTSAGTQCAAWHYAGTNGACVIMAGGFAVTKEPGTDLFARRFHAAGFSVLAFDYRCFGERSARVFYRPGCAAARVTCPLLVLVCDQDQSAPPGPAITAAGRAPRGELVRIPGGHYAPFLDGHDRALDAELSFLRRHLLSQAGPATPRRSGDPLDEEG